MKNHKVFQRLKNEEDNKKNISLNNRYHKNHLTIINTSDSNTFSALSFPRISISSNCSTILSALSLPNISISSISSIIF